MAVALGLLLVSLLIQAALLGWGILVGWLLHRLFPSIDLGTGILSGVITGTLAFYLAYRLTASAMAIRRFGPDDEDEEDEEDESPRTVVLEPPPLSRAERRRRRPRHS